MLKPDYETAKKFAEKYSVLPLYRELQGDSTTPIAILRKLSQKKKRYFLLESVEAQERWGRYSGHLQKRNCEGGKQRWDKDGKDGKTAACFTGDFKGLPYAGISGTAAFYRRIGGIFCILYDRLCRTCFKHKRECICGF